MYLDNCTMYKWTSLEKPVTLEYLDVTLYGNPAKLMSLCPITLFLTLMSNKRWVSNMYTYLSFRQTERFQPDINGPPKFASYWLIVNVLKPVVFVRIILFLQEYIYYLQEGDEICYNIFSTPLKKKKNKKKMFIFQMSFILFTMSIVILQNMKRYRF